MAASHVGVCVYVCDSHKGNDRRGGTFGKVRERNGKERKKCLIKMREMHWAAILGKT